MKTVNTIGKYKFRDSESRTWISEILIDKHPDIHVLELPSSLTLGRRFAVYNNEDLLLKEIVIPWEKMYATKDLQALIKLYQDITRETFGLE